MKIKLTGPKVADNGAMITLTAKISTSLKRIGSKAITWSLGGSVGTVSFWVKAGASAMGMAKYRAAWRNPGGGRLMGVEPATPTI